jgi:gluconolactonase
MSQRRKGVGRPNRLDFNAKPVKFAGGFRFLEGPAFDWEGHLVVVDASQSLVAKLAPDGKCTEFCNTGGKPTGSAFHPDRRLFCADGGLKAIVEIPPAGGSFRIFADRCAEDGEPFRGPNDLRFNRNGDLYWTDPPGSTLANRIGCVYWATPDGHVRRFAHGMAFPNGLCFSADWSTLLVAETNTDLVHAFEVRSDGSAGKHWIYAHLESRGGDGRVGGADGMAFDADGNLWVAHWGKGEVAVVDRAGKTFATFHIPDCNVTNLAFHNTDLYVTAFENGAASVYRLSVGIGGHPLFSRW